MSEIVCTVLENDHCQVTSAPVKEEQLCDGRLANSQHPWDVFDGAGGLI